MASSRPGDVGEELLLPDLVQVGVELLLSDLVHVGVKVLLPDLVHVEVDGKVTRLVLLLPYR